MAPDVIGIRHELPEEIAATRDVNTRAFGRYHEARLVDTLRSNDAVWLSLVATDGDRIVGHILYSPVEIDRLTGAGLGPMAVLPEYQRCGIGTRLVEAGNRELRVAGCPFVAVVGHPAFYPRFGFRPARPLGITCEWDVPDDVFLIAPLDPAKMQGVTGLARYRPEFSALA